MGLFSRLRRRSAGTGAPSGSASSSKAARGAASRHLEEFATSRKGVEGFVEPATTVTPTTLLLVAHDGEWTRRAVPDRETAFGFARRLGVPVYDVHLSGYPQRMRDYNARQKRDGGAGPR
ncbi:hypothetical protein ACFP6A_14170 [Quadrisphaera sp. GCM10027208]|uniref:hypothetical protein n=1 Tax=Quadrisphaera sp. GCM10027208 TaxID=3273423 RepID=UPI00360963A1|nr:hypothetical protein HJG43_08965 [Kineosporiaceae bacterium SCSIO 59966]